MPYGPDADPVQDPDPTPTPTPSGDDGFEAWYRDTIQANPERFDPAHFTRDQAKAWYPLWTGKGFKSSKVDAQGNPIQGDDFAHPDECPPGTQAFGQNKCVPSGQIPGQGGGGGGGVGGPGGGGPGGAGGGLDWGSLQGMLSGFKPNDFYGLSDIYQNLLKGGKGSMDFLAPTLQQGGQDITNAQRSIMRGMPAGGQRDKAMADLASKRATMGISARQGLLPSALGGLAGLSAQGNQQFGANLGAFTQGKGFENQFNIASMDDATRRMLGMGQLNLGQQGLDWQKEMFGQTFPWEQEMFNRNFGERTREFDIGQSNWLKDFGQNQRNQNRSFWGGIFGTLGGLGGALGGAAIM